VDSGETLATQKIDLDANPNRNPSILTIGQTIAVGGLPEKHFAVRRSVEVGGEGSELVVTVARGTLHPALFVDEFYLEACSVNWLGGAEGARETVEGGGRWRGVCRVRHGQPLCGCEIWLEGSRERVCVRVDSPMRGVAAGQVCVLYEEEGGMCVAGAEIAASGESYHERGLQLETQPWSSGENDRTNARV
jgi:tRNA U34 2-thiouridine synthase MnmA/TrmU